MFKTNTRRIFHLTRKKWLASLLSIIMLISLFPAAAWAAGSAATLSIITAPDPLTESYIRSNPITIDLTLTNNTWASSIIDEDEGGNIAQVYLPTLKSGFAAATDSNAWTNLLNAATSFKITDVSTNYTLEITIPTSATYDILANQTVTFTPPAALLQDSSNVPAPQSFTITADPQATLSGSLTSGATESDIVAGGKQLTITLLNCQWDPAVATDATERTALFADVFGANSDIYNALVAAPNPSTVIKETQNSDSSYTIVTITLPPVPGYNISSLQTFTLHQLDGTLLNLGSILENISNPSFSISSDSNTISLNTTPSILTESGVKSGSSTTLTMTLSDNTWDQTILNDTAKQTALLNGFSVSTDTAAWNNLKTAILNASPSPFALSNSNSTLTITIPPPTTGYSILSDQQVTVTVPSTVLTNNYSISNTLSFTITANPSVSVSGTLTQGVNSLDVVNGGKTIVATLYNATWNSDVTTALQKREKLIGDLLTPSTDSAGTWASIIPTIKAQATYALTDSKTVTITLPPILGFNISSSITIAPATSSANLTDLQNLTTAPSPSAFDNDSAAPSFAISPVANQSAALSGTATTATESDIVIGAKQLVITLAKDAWVPDVVSNSSKLTALINGIENTDTTNSANTTAWNAVQGALNSSNVVRTSDTVLTINLPPVPAYALTSDQTIRVTIPATCTSTLPQSQTIDAGTFTIKAVTASLSGTAVTTPLDSKSVIAGGKTIVITLNNATWTSDVTSPARLDDLLNCFTTSANWTPIKSSITPANITLSGKNILTIKLPAIANYVPSGIAQMTWQILPSVSAKLINETISKTLTASPTIQIGDQTATSTSAALSGAMSMKISDVVTGGKKVIITLTGGTWDSSLPNNSTKIKALVNGFKLDPNNNDSKNWTLVQTALTKANPSATFSLGTTSATNDTLTITLPAVTGYNPVNTQKVTLTIPKSTLTSASSDVNATGQLEIDLPSLTNQGSLQALLDNGSFATAINTIPLDNIYLKVPVKYISTIVCNQASLGNTTVTSLDFYTDNSVASINVTVGGATGAPYTSSTSVPSGNGKKFNVGFSTVNDTTSSSSTSQSSSEVTINVRDSSNNTLQTDIVIKVSGSKKYTFGPSTDLSGTYSIYTLMTGNQLLSNILNYYIPADLTVETL
ncbi:hypothetical protein REC12_10030 [Desulfosporosinus sp. PR]|uniref:beta strand repeat-containing protein n=1 Tax=Candidatus Desulfosporosinus nitrosoreducens TaxID=3401928 RepID=UPI0027FF639D|nr:hypothetical protein [Desulfosporosinus sp. PR]MDQ7093927.1 hypothetical protein [Desulfosporosinus sp. PR]